MGQFSKSKRAAKRIDLNAQRRSADVYAFGMVFFEIMFREAPFNSGVVPLAGNFVVYFVKNSILVIISMIKNGETVTPTIPKEHNFHNELVNLCKKCWTYNPDGRPNVKHIRKVTDTVLRM
jgi:guanylate cyclase